MVPFRCLKTSLKGNPVKFRDGPAAVTGDDHCINATDFKSGRRSCKVDPEVRKPA